MHHSGFHWSGAARLFQWPCGLARFFFMGPAAIALLSYLLFYTRYYWISLMYLVWYVADRGTAERGGRRWNWVRRWRLWRDYADFFPVKLVKEAELDPTHNYVIGSHPHGVLCSGAFCNFATEGTDIAKVYPGMTFTLTTLSFQYVMPFYREFFMTSGSVTASRASIEYVLSRRGNGQAVVVVVGGAPESLHTRPNTSTVNLILSRRKGFVRLALKNGAHLVPSFSFGENEVFDQVNNPVGSRVRRLQDSLQKIIGLAPVLIKGRGIFQYSFGIIPNRRPITTVVGEPIVVSKIENPSNEQVDQLHEIYVQRLVQLFERHKNTYYSGRNVTLNIL